MSSNQYFFQRNCQNYHCQDKLFQSSYYIYNQVSYTSLCLSFVLQLELVKSEEVAEKVLSIDRFLCNFNSSPCSASIA